ncbi:MAG TPA: LytTR family DNA-binding domain-containing protein [Bacteroidales bacterium]|nr:LytTR family DNA-binding domain-containing protein [Bacteroidales bacterium]
MATANSKWINKKYPQNIIIRNPFLGMLIFLGFIVIFVIIYKPLQVHESRFFPYQITVAIYCLILAIPLTGLVKLLKSIKYFSDSGEWTILKEILSTSILLFGMGIIVYFLGFLLESPEQRWNLSTFLNSLISAFLIGIIPFMFFTIINYRYLFVTDIFKSFDGEPNSLEPGKTEEMIRIGSQLKKEELIFYPSQLLYAESDGNYTVFYLNLEGQVKKRIIRNSISNIEQQLSVIPYFFRIHRAFLINVRKVISQKGNTLGYRLKLSGIENEIPVSRQKTHDFDQILKKYH